MPYAEVRTRHVARNKQKEIVRHAQTLRATPKTYSNVTRYINSFFNFISVLPPGRVFSLARGTYWSLNDTEMGSKLE
jgi:hypothetical protein